MVGKSLRIEVVAGRFGRPGVGFQVWGNLLQTDPPVPGVNHRPAFFPGDGSEKGLAAEVVKIPVVGAGGERHHPPLAGGGVDQVGMAWVGDRLFKPQVAVGEDRVARAAHVRAADTAASNAKTTRS